MKIMNGKHRVQKFQQDASGQQHPVVLQQPAVPVVPMVLAQLARWSVR